MSFRNAECKYKITEDRWIKYTIRDAIKNCKFTKIVQKEVQNNINATSYKNSLKKGGNEQHY